MVISALQAAFRTSDEGHLEQRRRLVAERLAARLSDPSDETTEFLGTVIFSSGLVPGEVEALADEYEFEVTAAEAKLAVGEMGEVVTMGIGARDLLPLSAFGLSQRLFLATGNRRYRLLQPIIAAGSDVEKQQLLEALKDPQPTYYAVTVIAHIETFGRLQNSDRVAAILVDERQEPALAHRKMEREFRSAILRPPSFSISIVNDNMPPLPAGGLIPIPPSDIDR